MVDRNSREKAQEAQTRLFLCAFCVFSRLCSFPLPVYSSCAARVLLNCPLNTLNTLNNANRGRRITRTGLQAVGAAGIIMKAAPLASFGVFGGLNCCFHGSVPNLPSPYTTPRRVAADRDGDAWGPHAGGRQGQHENCWQLTLPMAGVSFSRLSCRRPRR